VAKSLLVAFHKVACANFLVWRYAIEQGGNLGTLVKVSDLRQR